MLTAVRNHPTPAALASAPVSTIDRVAPIPFAANDDGLYKLMRGDRARRFADLRATFGAALREADRAHGRARRAQTEPGSLSPAAARLKDATTDYQRHALAWYALSRINEARAARAAIARCREALAAENRCNADTRADDRTTATPPHLLNQETRAARRQRVST